MLHNILFIEIIYCCLYCLIQCHYKVKINWGFCSDLTKTKLTINVDVKYRCSRH